MRHNLAVVFASVTLLTTFAASEACSGPADCSYNGRCNLNNHECKCFPQFEGDSCDIFAFEPLDIAKGVGFKQVSSDRIRSSSWGGTVIYSEEDKVQFQCLLSPFQSDLA